MAGQDPHDIDPLDQEPDFEEESAGDDQVEQAWERFKRSAFSKRTIAIALFFVILVIAFLYGVLPQLPGIQDSLTKVKDDGDRTWLAAALLLELGSYASYIWLFRAVFIREVPRVGWGGSYRISMAGVAATRLFGAAGAGGIALTFWAVRKAGMGKRLSVSYIVAFYVVLYGLFMIALLTTGILLRTGAVPGRAPFGVTVVPAAFAGLVIFFFLLTMLIPGNLERIAERWSHGRGRMAGIAKRFAAAPALLGHGTRVALKLIRGRDVGLLGALGWWAFDIATLWASFKAFSDAPPLAVLVMGYLVGMIANVIPTPGGVGAVEGGMIGSYAAFGVPLYAATAAVLAYRFFAFILPTLPGLIAFVRLRREVGAWEREDATIKSKVMAARGSPRDVQA
ncbi:MAG: flippase-like domain-containing protein [Actinobacteria bacterium]|nr:flippase-like domain-containing protein [Actinomycetota bacterium]